VAVLQGIEALDAKLAAIDRSVRQRMLMRALKENVEPTRSLAGQLSPLRTGRLAAGEKIASVPSLSNADTATVRVGPARKVFYGLFNENGTIHMTATPFLGPAYIQTKDSVLRNTAEDFKQAVEHPRG
jgi:HK97 gp10 family phage protein